MRKSTRKLTTAAMLAVLAIALLYISSLLPTMRFVFAVVAGLATAAALIECGFVYAALLYVVAAALGLLVLPTKGTAALYALFFGYYPLVKSLAERIPRRVLEWVIKLAVFNAALTAGWLLYRYGLLAQIELPRYVPYLLYPAGNAAFVVYDFAFSRLVGVYFTRIKGRKERKL